MDKSSQGKNSKGSTVLSGTKAIENMKPESRLLDTGENRGLWAIKGKTGGVRFIYRYRSPIKKGGVNPLKQFTIGYYPAMSLAEARVKLQELKVNRKNGICPATEKERAKEKEQLQEQQEKETERMLSFTMADLVESYLTNHIEDKVSKDGVVIRKGARMPKGASEVRRTLYADVVRVLGEQPVAEINHRDIVDLIMQIVYRGAPVQAGNVLRELSAAFDYSIDDILPDDYVNPCYQAKGILARKKIKLTSKKGKRVLSDQEISKLLRWLPGSAYTPTQKNVLLFALMTGCRTGEVVEADWNDFDLDAGVWTLTKNKTDIPRNVQLSQQTLAFLVQLRKTTGQFLFPSQKTGMPIKQKQLTEQAWHMRKNGRFIKIDKWSPHDLRRTVRTGLARLGCPFEVAEAVLGHTKGGIEGVYDLHSYEPEAKKWLQIWNDHLDELTNKKIAE